MALLRKIIIALGAIIALFVLSTLVFNTFMSSKPKYLGVTDGKLARLSAKPNNLSTYEAGKYPQAQPFRYTGEMAESRDKLIAALNTLPRVNIESVDGNYVHATFRSRLFRFVDDVEFLFDDEAKIIHFRAGARTGQSDLGVNQKRMEEIRAAFVR